jgi:hypothetical protein
MRFVNQRSGELCLTLPIDKQAGAADRFDKQDKNSVTVAVAVANEATAANDKTCQANLACARRSFTGHLARPLLKWSGRIDNGPRRLHSVDAMN